MIGACSVTTSPPGCSSGSCDRTSAESGRLPSPCLGFFASRLPDGTSFPVSAMMPEFALVREPHHRQAPADYGNAALGWRARPSLASSDSAITHGDWRFFRSPLRPTIVSFSLDGSGADLHSTIFEPYFVAGANFSGSAALILPCGLRELCTWRYLPGPFHNLGAVLR